MTKRQKGLTLIELMVVVAVLAILSAVAYPLYTNQVQKSRRADAKTALQTIALAQERFFTINGEYAGNLSTLQVSPDIQGGASDEGYYTITLTLAGADNEQFTVTAAAGGPQAADTDCAQFTINHQGVKTATDGGSTNCW
ncbi:MAG: type IV pilin protein [Sedimenticolaceae bacterium]